MTSVCAASSRKRNWTRRTSTTNIHAFKLDQVEGLNLNVDKEWVKIKYATGARTELPLNAISLGPGKVPEEYYKTNGVIRTQRSNRREVRPVKT